MIYSHTIVKNGMPFIEPVLRNVEPYVDKMLVTISQKSNDGTWDLMSNLKTEFNEKLVVDIENVSDPSLLTVERQKQLDHTPQDAWVLFLDADDWWPKEDLQLMQMYLAGDIDGLAVNPFQVVDRQTYDDSWRSKWFTKWFKNQPGVHYEKPWPRDLIFKDDELLYWRTNPRVPRVAIKYFHLSNLMNWRFRDEKWAEEYKSTIGKPLPYPPGWKEEVDRIFSYIK